MLWVILSLAISRFPIAYLSRKNYIFMGFFPTHMVHFWLKADLSQLKRPTQQFRNHAEPTVSRELEDGYCRLKQPTQWFRGKHLTCKQSHRSRGLALPATVVIVLHKLVMYGMKKINLQLSGDSISDIRLMTNCIFMLLL